MAAAQWQCQLGLPRVQSSSPAVQQQTRMLKICPEVELKGLSRLQWCGEYSFSNLHYKKKKNWKTFWSYFLFTFYIRLQNVSYEVSKTGDAKPAHSPPSARALDSSAYNAKLPSPRQIYMLFLRLQSHTARKVVVTASCI